MIVSRTQTLIVFQAYSGISILYKCYATDLFIYSVQRCISFSLASDENVLAVPVLNVDRDRTATLQMIKLKLTQHLAP